MGWFSDIFNKPFSRMSECRHRAIECALIFGEARQGGVGIASGPVVKDPKLWHSQAYLLDPAKEDITKPWKWLVNKGFSCEIGEKEPFTPERFDTVMSFLRWQFPFVE